MPTVRQGTKHEMPPTTRRRRLIDALTSRPNDDVRWQKADDAEDPASPLATRLLATSQDLTMEAADRRGGTPTSNKIKFTYSQIRATPSESRTQNDIRPLALEKVEEDTLSESHTTLSSTVPPSFDFEDGPAEDDPQPAIKSIHELRRAGANNRTSDEMDDLLGRIGNPARISLTMRRNALCELALRLQREQFATQFRDHASRDNLARGVGSEADLISGFCLSAAVIIFLDHGPAPHLVRQLCNEGLGKLMGRLLLNSEDIDALTSKRSNVSRTIGVSMHQLKDGLLQMAIWHGAHARQLSPRTLSLRLLEVLSRCSERRLLEILVGDLETELVAVAAECAKTGEADRHADYQFVLYGLEVLSSAGITPGVKSQRNKATPNSRHYRTIAKFLTRALDRWPESRGETDRAALKLAINITNTEHGAGLFAENGTLISQLAGRIAAGLDKVKKAIEDGSLENDIYDELLLILGVTINIVEHCPAARTLVNERSLVQLIRIWRGHQHAISEVRSIHF